MVDKVDRPDPVKKYEILSTKETHDEGQRKQDERHDDDEYSTPGTEISWNKFQTSAPTRRSIRLQRSSVQQAIFRQATMQSRSAILELDLILTDGRTLSRAQIASNNLDDYWKWKGWVPGQALPLELMVQGQFLEVSVHKPSNTMSGESITPRTKTPPPVVRSRKEINWLLVTKIAAGAIVLLWIVGKLARWW